MKGRGWERGWLRSAAVALAGLALIESAGCQSSDSNDDQLLALLHDDPLTTVTASALSAKDGSRTNGTGGNLTFGTGVTVAAWFNPVSVNQTRTLFRKRDDGSSSAFALVLNGGKYQFVVNLGNGKAASVIAPSKAKANSWVHVGATYDGTWLRLYLDGTEVAKNRAVGSVAPAPGPLLMGDDGSKRLFAGLIDEAFFDARALAASEVFALTCLRHPFTVAATPPSGAPTTSGVPASFDIAISNNDSAACGPSDYFFEQNGVVQGLSVDPGFQSVSQLAAGTTAHLALNVAGSDDLDSGTFPVPFAVFQGSPPFANAFGSVDFNFVASGGRVSKPREHMITTASVVGRSSARTNHRPPGRAGRAVAKVGPGVSRWARVAPRG